MKAATFPFVPSCLVRTIGSWRHLKTPTALWCIRGLVAACRWIQSSSPVVRLAARIASLSRAPLVRICWCFTDQHECTAQRATTAVRWHHGCRLHWCHWHWHRLRVESASKAQARQGVLLLLRHSRDDYAMCHVAFYRTCNH